MSKKKANKKIRTRDHVIADLSANHVEFHALKNHFSIERFEKDYGYDLNLYTYSTNGEIENGSVFIQLKATDNIKKIKNNQFVSFPLEKRDLNTWLFEPYPCVFVVYDAVKEEAFWLYVQSYYENLKDFDLDKVNEYHSVNIPITNIINQSSIKRFQEFKSDVLKQIEGTIKHNG